MAKYTQGEWIVDRNCDNTYDINSVDPVNGSWKAVATVTANELGSRPISSEEARANARLIASALKMRQLLGEVAFILAGSLDKDAPIRVKIAAVIAEVDAVA